MELVEPDSRLGRLLDYSEAQGASDVHCRAGRPIQIRVNGRLQRLDSDEFPPVSTPQLREMLRESFSEGACRRVADRLEVDLSFHFRDHRYRANFSKQQGEQSFSLRIVPQQRQNLSDLQLPTSLRDIVTHLRGLALITGPTGQGKSTTARALIQELNRSQACRVITIEDPIECVFADDRCHFEQREVGIDTASFADGIRNAMRQDPDVIFVGEIRDRESIHAAMQAAETGHLVITTLHADSTAQAVGRLLEFYPTTEQSNIRGLLSRNLNTVVTQRLIPNTRDGRTPCLERMKRNPGIQDAIEKHELHRLAGAIEACVGEGMHSFDQYLMQLLASSIITEETARRYAVHERRLDMALRGIETTAPILTPD